MMGHYELSVNRSDPGPWLMGSGLKAEVLAKVNQYERDVKMLQAENEVRKGEIQALFRAMFTPPEGLRPRVEALEKKP